MPGKRKARRRPSQEKEADDGRKTPPGGVRWLHFVRHGEYAHEGEFGVLGGPLTPLGRKQAAFVAQYLRALPVGVIHTSDLRRARETADVISRAFPGVPLKVSRLLRETCIIPLGRVRVPREACAGLRDRFERIRRRWLRPSRSTRHEVVVCHGNLIRSLVVMALGVKPLTAWARINTYNCAVTTLSVRPGGAVAVETVNDLGHLPRDIRT